MKGHQAIKLLGEGFHSIRMTKMPEREIQACIDLIVSDTWEVGIFGEDTQSYKWFGEVENWEIPKLTW